MQTQGSCNLSFLVCIFAVPYFIMNAYKLNNWALFTCMAAGNKMDINCSERGSGDDLTRLLCTSKAIPFNPFLSSEAFRIDTRVGTSLFWRGPEQPGLAAKTLKISWERLVMTGSLLYFRNMAIASGETLLSWFQRGKKVIMKFY